MVTCRPEPYCTNTESSYGTYNSRENCLDDYGAAMLCVEDTGAYDCRDFTEGCDDNQYQYPGVGVYFKRDNCSGADGTEMKVYLLFVFVLIPHYSLHLSLVNLLLVPTLCNRRFFNRLLRLVQFHP